MRRDEHLREVLVAILVGEPEECTELAAGHAPVVGMLTKPLDSEQFFSLARVVECLGQAVAGCPSSAEVEATV